MFDEIPWSTKPSSLLLFFFVLIAQSCTDRKEGMLPEESKSWDAIVLMFFPTWWLAHLAHLWGTGGAGNRTGLSRCRC